MGEAKFDAKTALNEIIAAKRYCRIDRAHVKAYGLTGMPLRICGELCLVHVFYGFIPDGLSVVRLKDVSEIIYSEEEDFFDRILSNEGISERIDYSAFSGRFDTMRELLQILLDTGEMVAIRCDRKDEFYIGRIKKINKAYILFHHFYVNGQWKETMDRINLGSITNVILRDQYIELFEKYLPAETSN